MIQEIYGMGKKDYVEKTRSRIRFLIDTYYEGSQQAFADAVKINKASVSQYVNGSNTPGNITAGKIAAVCRVDPLWVMGFDVPMKSEDKEIPMDWVDQYSEQERWMIHQFRGLHKEGKETILNLLKMLEQNKQTE
jgi:transcriptional regulator with XRE-family HTH domain